MKYCNKQSVSSERTLHYLKVNEAFNDESTNKRRELQEFSNDYLAYLIDDEWSVSVWGFTTSFKIVLLSPRSVKRNRVHHDDVTWLSVKNHIIPFVQMLSNTYQVGYEGSSSIIRIEGTYSDDIHIRNIDQLEDLSDDMLFYSFSIVVKKDGMKHLKMFKESVDNVIIPKLYGEEVDELKDLCDNSLVYLLDDGYRIDIFSGAVVTTVSLILPDNSGGLEKDFYWDDVKDYYIPLLQILSRRYRLGGYTGEISEVYFKGDFPKFSQYCTVEQVINDDIPKIVLDKGVWGINIKVIDKI